MSNFINKLLNSLDDRSVESGAIDSHESINDEQAYQNQEHVYQSRGFTVSSEDEVKSIKHFSSEEKEILCEEILIDSIKNMVSPHTSDFEKATHFKWVFEPLVSEEELRNKPFSCQFCLVLAGIAEPDTFLELLESHLRKEGTYELLRTISCSPEFIEYEQKEAEMFEKQSTQHHLFGAPPEKQFRAKNKKKTSSKDAVESYGVQGSFF